MVRLTEKKGENFYLSEALQQNEFGFFGEAVDHLGKLEDLIEEVQSEQTQLEQELEQLRIQKKAKSLQFQRLLAEKMMNQRLLTRLEFKKIL